MNRVRKIILIIVALLVFMPLAHAAYTPFNTNVAGNIGIGSANPGQRLDVNGSVRATSFIGNGSGLSGINTSQWTVTNTNDVYLPNNGNVGIGTSFTTTSALAVMNGNVGIGTWKPAYALDVTGTINVTGAINVGSTLNFGGSAFQALADGGGGLELNKPSYGPVFDINGSFQTCLGYYCSAGSGSTTVSINRNILGGMAATGGIATDLLINDTLIAAANNDTLTALYISPGFNNGAFTGVRDYGLIVANGNVGIGTTLPSSGLSVTSNGESIGSTYTNGISAPSNGLIVQGNVGIGSITPGQKLDVQGTVRATNFVGNGSGLTGINTSQWTVTNTNDVYLPNNGNVGIGTSFTTTSALTVMNGNVGIGTWVPSSALQVNHTLGLQGGNLMGGTAGNGITFAAAGNNYGLDYLFVDANTPGAGIDVQYSPQGNGVNLPYGFQFTSDATSVKSSLLFLGLNNADGLTQTHLITVSNDNTAGNPWDLVLSNPPNNTNWANSNNVYKSLVIKPGTPTNTLYLSGTGNIGIGTSIPSGGLTVMNGNVGIGTWVPAATLDVSGSFRTSGNVGNTTLNATGGNVGIGSVNPGSLLDVAGNIRGTQMIDTGVAASSLVYANASQQLSAVTLGTGLTLTGATLSASGSGTVNSGTTNQVAYYTGATALSGSPNFVFDGTNVGIGTTKTSTAALSVMNGNVGIGTWVPGGALIVQTGNLGIGSTSPSNPLEINRNQNTVTDIQVINSSTGSAAQSRFVARNSANDAEFGIISTGYSGLPGGSAFVWNNANAPILLATNGTEKVRIDATGNVGIGTMLTTTAGLTVMNGNVGIGTWVPSENLQVVGSSSNGARVYIKTTNSGSSGLSGFKLDNDTGNVSYEAISYGSGNNASWFGVPAANTTFNLSYGSSNAGEGIGTLVNSPVFFGTNNLERMRITGSGNIGIGTTNPLGGLSVMNGNVGIGTWVPSRNLTVKGINDSDSIRITNASGSDSVGMEYNDRGSGNNGFSVYDQTAGHEVFTVWGNGEAAVGTTYAQNQDSASLNANGLIVQGNVGVGTTIASNGGLLVMNGNVGIGTWVPKGTLDVGSTGTICLGGTCNSSWPSGSSQWTTTNTHDIYLPSNGNVGIGTTITSAGASLTVMNGNVGIGTWVPTTALQLNGNISFEPGVTGNINVITSLAGLSPDLIIQGAYVCFAAGTKITMADGSLKNIQVIKIGDIVKSYDVANHRVKDAKVIKLIAHSSKEDGNGYLVMTMQNGRVLKVTPNHPIYVDGQWKQAGTLKIGDRLMQIDGSKVKLVSIRIINRAIPVYNLELEQYHTYFAQGVLVHNSCVGTPGNLFLGGVNVSGKTTGGTVLAYNPNNSTTMSAGGLVGIGTIAVGSSNSSVLTIFGNVGIGKTSGDSYLTTNAPSGGMIVEGNVGIGTWVPAAALDMGVTGGIRLGGVTQTSWPSSSSQWTTTNTNDIYLPSNGNVGIGTNKTTTAALTVMNGNVGIGTWIPGGLLDVHLGSLQGAYLGTSGVASFVQATNGMLDSSNGAFIIRGSSSVPVAFGTGTFNSGVPSQLYIQTSSGNIGIGTTTPVGGLSIMNGNVGIGTWVPQAVSFNVVGGNVGIGTNLNNHAMVEITGNGAKELFRVNDSGQNDGSPFMIASNGNVGIGTVTPSSFFTLSHDSSGTGVTALFQDTPGTYYNWIFGAQNSGVNEFEITPSTTAGGLTFNRPAILLNSSGNVGIGTTIPGGGLVVMSGNVGIGTWVPVAALQVNNTITYFSEYNDGNSGTSFTINWQNGNNQKITLTGNSTFTFTAPGGPTHLTLDLIQDGTGSRLVTWPAAVLWPGKVAPVLTTTASGIDIVNCYYNGTNYYCSAALNFG